MSYSRSLRHETGKKAAFEIFTVCLNIRSSYLTVKFLLGNKMSLEQKAHVLEASASAQCGVRDVVQMLTCKTSSVVSLLKEMEEERLIESRETLRSGRGRPKKVIVPTSLGLEFLEVYRRMRMMPLKARKADLERAVKDALYAERLLAFGHSPFKLFMELNMIAYNIKVSSKTS
jgi:DNA-binding MarR family transcriptional regulator